MITRHHCGASVSVCLALALGCGSKGSDRARHIASAEAPPSASQPEQAPAPSACRGDQPASLTAEGLGELRLGMAMRAIPLMCPQARETTLVVGSPLSAYVANSFGARLVLIPDDVRNLPSQLGEIRVEGGRFRTAGGLGKGSAFSDIRRAFGPPSLVFSCDARPSAVEYRSGEHAMLFVFDVRMFGSCRAGGQLGVDEVPDTTRVTGMSVFWVLHPEGQEP